jgi:hypothetical protein
MSIACYALQIRHPRAHILPSLTATCQVCTVALKAGLSTYNRFAPRTLNTPDGETAQPDPDVMRVTGQTPTPATGRLVFELKTEGEEEGEETLEKRLPVSQQAAVGGFVSKINGDSAVFSCWFGRCSQCVAPLSSGVVW